MSKIRKKETNQNLTYISLFSSAGIGCYGFKKAGFDCIATSELLEKRLLIQKNNKKCKYDSGYILGDITNDEISSKIFNEISKWNKTNEVDVVIATPPCQGMSVANQKKKNELKRNSLVVKAIELTKKINPKIFIFENVSKFLQTTCLGTDKKLRKIKDEIEKELSNNYLFLSKVINFKNYGSNSSRLRTLVIGVRQDFLNKITPFELFPEKRNEKTLKEIIGSFLSLKFMDDFDDNNVLHHFKPYDKKMLNWIKDLKEGQSAFENKNPKNIPHRIVNGNIIHYSNSFGDKYKRQSWNKVAPCIHTANDCLASQNTIHPKDNRVFSIAELMEMMTIPKNFVWDTIDPNTLKTKNEKLNWLKINQGNIRKCIGEAVPTNIFYEIASNIKKKLIDEIDIYNDIKKFEINNSKRHLNAAFYTDKINLSYVYDMLPDFDNNKEIFIMEPSVGAGNFLMPIFKKYENALKVNLTLIDIDKKSLNFTKKIIDKIGKPENFNIDFKCIDFLAFDNNEIKKYDLIIGNPPFLKIKNNKEFSNLFEAFWYKSIKIANEVIFINPKYILSSPIYSNLRQKIKDKINFIVDFGERGFKGVKIETLAIRWSNNIKNKDCNVKVNSIPKQIKLTQNRNYIFDPILPFWIIYRNDYFDNVYRKLKKDIFNFYKNYEISNKNLSNNKNDEFVWIIKSKNINFYEPKLDNIPNYDKYMKKNELTKNKLFIKLINNENFKHLYLMPNLTYYPRIIKMPKNTFVNGSVLIVELKDKNLSINKKDIEYFYSNEFRDYYLIALNYSTRTLNIDLNTIKFFGIIR